MASRASREKWLARKPNEHLAHLMCERPFGAQRIVKHAGRPRWGGASGRNLNGSRPWTGRSKRVVVIT